MAWGLTNQGADMVDLFHETIDWEKKTYRYQNRDYPLTSREVEIKIKGRDPLKKTLYYCDRKPVLTEVFKELGMDISLDWTGFDSMDIQGFFLLNRARNFDEFLEAVKSIRMSPQNLVYADDQGNIAFRVIGSLPDRTPGTGNLISDGTVTRANWRGNIPEDQYPFVKNPSRGFIATANNKNKKILPYYLNGTYAPGYRYESIAAMLRDKSDIDVAYCQKMQTDTHSILAGKIQDLIKKFVKVDEKEDNVKKALEIVLTWDGDSRKDSVGATIYNTFYVRFAYQTLADELGSDLAAEYVGERYISMESFLEMVDQGSELFDDLNTPDKETVADIANRAFRESCTMLGEFYKEPDPAKWTWGKVHQIKFDHVLGASAMLRPLVNYGPLAFEGDGETNNRARFNEVAPPYITDLASAPRIIVKFDPEPRAYLMLITGENEYFLSKHNTDMTDAWLAHEYFNMDEEPAKYSMTLNP
jgi:penicillin amidase